MGCLSSEDLKEETNCSLNPKPTLNSHVRPVERDLLFAIVLDPFEPSEQFSLSESQA